MSNLIEDMGVESFGGTEETGESLKDFRGFGGSASLESQGLEHYQAPKEPVAKGLERDIAGAHPNLFALSRTALDFVPYANLLIFPSEREKFMQLDQQHQTRALLWHALDAATWGRTKALRQASKLLKFGVSPYSLTGGLARDIRYLGGGVSKIFGKGKRVVYTNAKSKFMDAGEAAALTGEFNYAEELLGKLKNSKFRAAERKGIFQALSGGTRRDLFNVTLDIAHAGKKHSKAWNRAIQKDTSRLYPGLKLSTEFASELGEVVLYNSWKKKAFKTLLEKKIIGEKLSSDYAEKNFRLITDKLYGKGIRIDDVSPAVFAKTIRFSLVGGKRALEKAALPGMGQYWIPVLKPVRFVLGHGEKFFGTYTHVYKKLKLAVRRANEHYFNSTLLYHKFLEDAGLGKLTIKPNGEFRFKNLKSFGEKDKENAFAILRVMDDTAQTLSRTKGVEKTLKVKRLAAQKIRAIPASENTKKLIETTRVYNDYLYGDLAKHQLRRNFRKIELTPLGKGWLKLYGRKFSYKMDSAFGTTSTMNNAEKILAMEEELKYLNSMFQMSKGVNPMFVAQGKDLKKILSELTDKFTYGQKNGWMSYLDDYTSRIGQKQVSQAQSWQTSLFEDRQAGILKLRKLAEAENQITSFSEMLERRTLAQSNEIFLYDDLGDVVDFIQTMPWKWQNYTEHYIARVVNKPSMIDHHMADILQSTIGTLERAVGKEGTWKADRVMKLAQTVNDFTYAGALGLKPYSTLRNLFQVSLVPGDLGGIKDIWTTAKGYVKAFSPERQAELRRMNIITEWAPEITLRPKMLKLGHTRKAFGKDIPSPTMSEVREFCLWGFKASDRWNRYTTGSAAITKWNGILPEERIGKIRGLRGKAKEAEFKKVFKELNLSTRDEWIELELKQLLRLEKFSAAKTRFTQNVVGNTQFLFGSVDAPVVTGMGGAVGKTGFIFQSWWMNYATQIHRYLYRGTAGEKIERIVTALLSNAMAYSIMAQIWGSRSARSATFLGPIPKTFNEYLVPPAFNVIYHPFAGAMATFEGDFKTAERHWWELTRSLAIFVPGGLQAAQMYRGAKKGGAKGLGRSILKLKAPER